MRARGTGAALTVMIAAAGACRPTLDDRPWLVTAPQIVGVKIDPAEAFPGQLVSAQVIAIDPAGALDAGATAWSFCRTGKPLGENRVVSDACIGAAAGAADGAGSPVSLAIPLTACQLFGPDTPQPARGAPPTRPRDPDASGGYYQPIAVALDGARAVALARVTCGLSEASFAIARAFQAAYRANQNPRIAGLAFQLGGADIDPAATATPRGAPVAIRLDWTAGDAESFPVFDRDTRALVDTREHLAVSWYVTGGTLEVAAASIDDDTAGDILSSRATWIAPAGAGTFDLVVVLRDSRGGSDAVRARLSVD